jgi:hypothetical protein
MRQDIKRIKASEVKAGDVIAFHNPRMDYMVEDVDVTSLGQVRLEHGNGTASDCLSPSDYVFIKKGV